MKIRTLGSMAVLCAVAMFGVYAGATSASSPANIGFVDDDKEVTGTIVKADTANNTFSIRTADDKEVEFTVDAETKYTLNGATASKEEALKVGAKAVVTCEGKEASRVDVSD